MKQLTIFTPTFNRAHLLPRLYESLKNQTIKDFVWMIIDDGSSDDTQSLVEQWQQENLIEIQYFYKKNGGMHTAHNLAYQKIETELNVCIDSDDAMPVNAVKDILDCWKSLGENSTSYSGIIALDSDTNGNLLGKELPENMKSGSYNDIFYKYKMTGDKKFVLRTKAVRNYPLYPEFEGEKLVPLGILYMMMGAKQHFAFLNKVLCVVEYQEQGSTNTIFKQYFQSPHGFMYARKMKLKYRSNLIEKIKNIIHLSTSVLILKNLRKPCENNSYAIFVILALPLGLLNYFFLKSKSK